MPTRPGDVLILQTENLPMCAVGLVFRDGQQDLTTQPIGYSSQQKPYGAAAETAARRLVAPGGRIFLKGSDTAWSQIST
jgi:hypothetical protein